MRTLVFFVLILLLACKATGSLNNRELSRSLKTEFNPLIMELKLINVDYRIKNEFWASSTYEFQNFYGDSTLTLFNQFEHLEFDKSGDSLIVNYKLHKDYNLQTPVIEFIDSNIYTDSAKYEIDIVSEVDNTFELYNDFEEGKLIFYSPKSNKHFKVRHYYKGGKSTNIITINEN